MAVDVFLKLGDINGESKDATYKDWIDVLAWSWGGAQTGTMQMGGGGGTGKVNIQDMSVTKYVDSSSTNLYLKLCTGKHYPEAKLIVRKAGDQPVEYVKITMTDVIISSLSTGGSTGDERTTENITLNFAKFKYEYTPQEETGAAGAVMDVTFNIKTNAPE